MRKGSHHTADTLTTMRIVQRNRPARPRPPLAERFWARVQKADGCWLWIGTINQDGYGRFLGDTRAYRGAHRVAYELTIGPIADGLQIDHICHNTDPTCPGGPVCVHRRCVNPAHMEPVTTTTNTGRGRVGNRTTCIHGHSLENAIHYVWKGRPRRYCRDCAVHNQAKHYVTRKKARRQAARHG